MSATIETRLADVVIITEKRRIDYGLETRRGKQFLWRCRRGGIGSREVDVSSLNYADRGVQLNGITL